MLDERKVTFFEQSIPQPETVAVPVTNQPTDEATQPEVLEFPSHDDAEQFWAHAHDISLSVAAKLCVAMTDSHSSEDIASGVVERLLRNQDKLVSIVEEQGSGNAKAYITTVTRNLVRDRVRRKNKIPMQSIDDPDYPLLDHLPSSGSPSHTFLGEDMIAALKRAIRHDGDKANVQAVVLHHVMGYTYDEIASIAGCKTGTVRSRIHRGLARLRELPEMQDLFQQHVSVQQA